MADAELAAIRAARLKELQQQQQQQQKQTAQRANAGAPTDVTSQQYPSAPLMQMLTSARQQEDEARLTILSAILSSGARERLHRIELVKPERARGVSDLLINMQKTGRVRAKITEEEFIGLLDQISAEETKRKETKIVYDRRKYQIDDEDGDDLDI